MRQSAFIAATLIAILGCSPKTDTAFRKAESLNVDWWWNRGEKESRILCEIKTLPKAAFLESVTTTTALSPEDKATISKAISPDVYTHANVTKAEYRGTRFLVIDQFYPKRITGKDNESRETVDGGSGTLELIVMGKTNGVQFSVVHYD